MYDDCIIGARPRPTSEGIETKLRVNVPCRVYSNSRPRPTSEGIETKQRTSGRGRRCGDKEPDPAPPPRGLKLNKPALVLMDIGHVLEPDPAPPPRGLKLEPSWTALSS